MKIMNGDEVVMIGERVTSILYKLHGCAVVGSHRRWSCRYRRVLFEWRVEGIGLVGWLTVSCEVNDSCPCR
jgi:hypothetical protein